MPEIIDGNGNSASQWGKTHWLFCSWSKKTNQPNTLKNFNQTHQNISTKRRQKNHKINSFSILSHRQAPPPRHRARRASDMEGSKGRANPRQGQPPAGPPPGRANPRQGHPPAGPTPGRATPRQGQPPAGPGPGRPDREFRKLKTCFFWSGKILEEKK